LIAHRFQDDTLSEARDTCGAAEDPPRLVCSVPANKRPRVAKLEKSDKPVKMASEQIALELEKLPEWSESGESIHRTYAFKDFQSAMGFINAIAQEAERVQHHPDLLVRYSKVTLTLATHDAGGITAKDFALATTADALAAGFAAPKPKK